VRADAYTVSGRNAGNSVHLCRRRCTVATVTRLSFTTTSKALQKCVYGDKCVTIFCNGIRLTEKRWFSAEDTSCGIARAKYRGIALKLPHNCSVVETRIIERIPFYRENYYDANVRFCKLVDENFSCTSYSKRRRTFLD